MDIVLIGAGNVAYSLAHAISTTFDHHVVTVYSRTPESANALATICDCQGVTNLSQLPSSADLYLILVPDRVIPAIVDELPPVQGTIAHTSGSTPLSALAKRREPTAIFYPFQTFTRGRRVSLEGVPICIEANSETEYSMLAELAKSLGSRAVRMDSDTRRWLHVEGVFCCNFVNHMMAIGERIAKAKGFDFTILEPLVRETIAKAMEGNAAAGQTGPAIRGDTETIARHMEMVNEIDPALSELYRAISESIMELSGRRAP